MSNFSLGQGASLLDQLFPDVLPHPRQMLLVSMPKSNDAFKPLPFVKIRSDEVRFLSFFFFSGC